MLGVYVTVPIACFRKGLAREYLETETLPPPATCYGMLLSLVGESDRKRHIGARVAPALLNKPAMSVVLRTVWRVKKTPLGSPGNTRPDYQQLLSGPSQADPFIALAIWLDSSDESAEASNLEIRVRSAVANPSSVSRFGGLSLGESTHLVDEVCLIENDNDKRTAGRSGQAFLLAERGRLTLPVWVDHVGSAKTNYVTGDLVACDATAPLLERMPVIQPKGPFHESIVDR